MSSPFPSPSHPHIYVHVHTHKHIHITHKYTQSHTLTLTHIHFPNTEAVRNGDLVLFGDVLDKYGHQFQAEKTYTLIIRLRHNVIKTGIRIISLSYSRISLADIAEKLQLDSAEDAEYIVAKVGNLLPMGFFGFTIFRECPFYCITELINITMNVVLSYCISVLSRVWTNVEFPYLNVW